MKMRRIAIPVGGVALIAVAMWLGMNSPDPDIQIVKGVRPIWTEIGRMPNGGPYLVYRIYSLHMPYDDAVKSALSDPRLKNFNQKITFDRAEFLSADRLELAGIERKEMIEGDPKLITSQNYSKSTGPVKDLIRHSPDPHGWITVTTQVRVGDAKGAMQHWAQKLMETFEHGRKQVFVGLVVEPKDGDASQPVDVFKGTTQLEGGSRVDGFRSVDY